VADATAVLASSMSRKIGSGLVGLIQLRAERLPRPQVTIITN
jgi:hypothetical protein